VRPAQRRPRAFPTQMVVVMLRAEPDQRCSTKSRWPGGHTISTPPSRDWRGQSPARRGKKTPGYRRPDTQYLTRGLPQRDAPSPAPPAVSPEALSSAHSSRWKRSPGLTAEAQGDPATKAFSRSDLARRLSANRGHASRQRESRRRRRGSESISITGCTTQKPLARELRDVDPRRPPRHGKGQPISVIFKSAERTREELNFLICPTAARCISGFS